LKNNASKNSGKKKRHQARSKSEDLIFALLQIDLEIKRWTKSTKIMEKGDVRELESTFCGALLYQNQGQNLFPETMVTFRVLSSKP
jgi:hypothetical protein